MLGASIVRPNPEPSPPSRSMRARSRSAPTLLSPVSSGIAKPGAPGSLSTQKGSYACPMIPP
jgi:hypothetical protein